MNNFTIWIVLGLIVALVVITMLNSSRQKKQDAEMQKTIGELKPGDRVKTFIGVYGKILSITETTDGKICVIETGDKNKSQIELDMRAICGRDEKKVAVYDENNNLISLDGKAVPVVDEKDNKVEQNDKKVEKVVEKPKTSNKSNNKKVKNTTNKASTKK